jgi:hypothetical protein
LQAGSDSAKMPLLARPAGVCGRNSVVECQLPKLDVVGSSPIARSGGQEMGDGNNFGAVAERLIAPECESGRAFAHGAPNQCSRGFESHRLRNAPSPRAAGRSRTCDLRNGIPVLGSKLSFCRNLACSFKEVYMVRRPFLLSQNALQATATKLPLRPRTRSSGYCASRRQGLILTIRNL